MTRLDLLLPFYGDEAFLRLAVESVRRQTEPDWRLIVVDDCYPSQTVASWITSLDDSRIVYHRNATQLGANGNYRRALHLATAQWVVFMGADDLMHADYVADLYRLMAQFPRAAVFQPGVRVIDETGEPIRVLTDSIKDALRPRLSEATELSGELLAVSLLRGNWTYFPSLCWRREAALSSGFRRGLNVVQDLGLLLDVVMQGGSLVVSPKVTFSYRRHTASDSAVRASHGSRFAEEREFFSRLAEEFQARQWTRAARSSRWHTTSRMHAAARMPAACLTSNWSAAWRLARHVVA